MSHLFMTDNLIDDATLSITTGTANAQYPLSNILTPITSKVFRSTGASVELLIDLGTITAIDTFCCVGDDKVGLGVSTISIYGSTTTSFASSVEIPIDLSASNNFGFKQFTENTYRYWKVVLTGSVYCELSNIYLGKATEITTNAIALGTFKYSNKRNADIVKSKYGIKFITEYNTQKMLSGAINLLNSSELATLREIFNDHTTTKPLFFITDPDDSLGTDSKYIHSGYFYFNKDTVFTNTNSGLWGVEMELIEVV